MIPTTAKEVEKLGWDYIDVIIFTGDAFVDHPSFGTACIARYLEREGYRVAVVPQPNWRDDLRDFRKLGAPRLFFGVNSGAMDSMVNHYTAARRLRHDDAYTPEGRSGARPDRAVIVYSQILKQLYPSIPVVIGGVEASLRRLTHYDYWSDSLMPSILVDSGADWLVYGMGERPMAELARAYDKGWNRHRMEAIPQLAFFRTPVGGPQVFSFSGGRSPRNPCIAPGPSATHGPSLAADAAIGPSDLHFRTPVGGPHVFNFSGDRSHRNPREAGAVGQHLQNPQPIVLHSYEECCADKKLFAENFHTIETNANLLTPSVLIEPTNQGYVRVNPPYPPATTQEMDSIWELPFTRLPHPRYAGKRIPAFDMIKDSIITHRGCFGGCNFCTIAAHQGKFIQSRSEASILREIHTLTEMPTFHGNISDLGAPTANMYGLGGRDKTLCAACRRKSCLFPGRCPNLDCSHERLLKLYDKVLNIKGVRHAYIGSGIRYDLFLDANGFIDESRTSANPNSSTSPNPSGREYLKALITKHTSGRLKVAPEHTSDKVLGYMAKPSFKLFERLRTEFDKINAQEGTHIELVPYFISSHPGCTLEDMRKLAANPSLKGIWMDQVQDFMPTPMTTSSVMFHTGLDPRTMEPIFVERDPAKKQAQKLQFFTR